MHAAWIPSKTRRAQLYMTGIGSGMRNFFLSPFQPCLLLGTKGMNISTIA
jgi:hypothetical protein